MDMKLLTDLAHENNVEELANRLENLNPYAPPIALTQGHSVF